jgi:hypothetical protein
LIEVAKRWGYATNDLSYGVSPQRRAKYSGEFRVSIRNVFLFSIGELVDHVGQNEKTLIDVPCLSEISLVLRAILQPLRAS